MWLHNFLQKLELVPEVDRSITLYCDNNGAVANSKEPRSHKTGKHIERKYHLIREIMQQGDVYVCKIPTESNLANLFTKNLLTKVFKGHLEGIGIRTHVL